VNAVLWTAKIEVPEAGAKVDFDAEDLNKNLDRKGKGEFKPILPPEKKYVSHRVTPVAPFPTLQLRR